MKTTFKTLLITLAVSTLAHAAPGDPVPNTFVNGTPADADQVNANFTEVINQIATVNSSIPAGSAVYDYLDYGHQFNQTVFSVTDSKGRFDTETRNFDRSTSGQISYTRDRKNGMTPYAYHNIFLNNNSINNELRFIKVEIYDPNDVGSGPTHTNTSSPGYIGRTRSMILGQTFGGTSNDSSTLGSSGTGIQTGALVAVNQSVTVPAGTFTGCITVAIDRSTAIMNNFKRVDTYCPGAGQVKQVLTQTSYTVSTYDSMNPPQYVTATTDTIEWKLSSCTDLSDLPVANCGGTP